MAPRHKRTCRNCPKPAMPETQGSKTAPPPPAAPQPITVLHLTSQGEGEKLWRHVLYGTGTCVSMIEGYTDLNMPGNPLDGLVALRDRITRLIKKHEATKP